MPRNSPAAATAGLTRTLLVASRCLVLITIIISVLLLSAGTFVYHAPESSSALRLGFKSLAMISYDGILPLTNKTMASDGNYDASRYLFTIHKFPNALSWECEHCPDLSHSPTVSVPLAGVEETGPHAGVDPLASMLRIADKALGAQQDGNSFWNCYRDAPQPEHKDCPKSDFFEAWAKSFHDFWLSGFSAIPISFIIYLLCIVIATSTLINEFLISYSPRHMKCRCFVWKRWCPFPAGTAEQLEQLPEHRWDRVRIFTFPLMLAYFFLLAFQESLMPRFFISILNFVDRRLPEGMSMRPRQNRPYMVLLWGNVFLCTIAVACVAWRYHLNKPKSHITLDNLSEFESTEDNTAGGLAAATTTTATFAAAASDEDDEEATEHAALLSGTQH